MSNTNITPTSRNQFTIAAVTAFWPFLHGIDVAPYWYGNLTVRLAPRDNRWFVHVSVLVAYLDTSIASVHPIDRLVIRLLRAGLGFPQTGHRITRARHARVKHDPMARFEVLTEVNVLADTASLHAHAPCPCVKAGEQQLLRPP